MVLGQCKLAEYLAGWPVFIRHSFASIPSRRDRLRSDRGLARPRRSSPDVSPIDYPSTARREATLARVDLCLAPRSRRPDPVTRHVRWEPGVGRNRAGGARRDRRRRTQDHTRVTGKRLLAGSARVRDPSLAIGDVHGAGLFSGRELAAGQLDDPTYLARVATLRTELAIAEEREPTHAVASADKVITKLRALPETWAMATPDGRAELLTQSTNAWLSGAPSLFRPV